MGDYKLKSDHNYVIPEVGVPFISGRNPAFRNAKHKDNVSWTFSA